MLNGGKSLSFEVGAKNITNCREEKWRWPRYTTSEISTTGKSVQNKDEPFRFFVGDQIADSSQKKCT